MEPSIIAKIKAHPQYSAKGKFDDYGFYNMENGGTYYQQISSMQKEHTLILMDTT